ncbi:hypothetical protein PQX77_015530 [Marasmius sp. AFHP31]|nr:hypothetical protein PQX77_015530 [Marasmius sp. AFHP31]
MLNYNIGGCSDTEAGSWCDLYSNVIAIPSSIWLDRLGSAELHTLANGMELIRQFDEIIELYLGYKQELACAELCANKTLIIPQVTKWYGDWTFNVKTQSWLYDPTSTSMSQLNTLYGLFSPALPPEGTQPKLNADEIVIYFEETFGDLLYLIASKGGVSANTWGDDLSDSARHGLFTFGSVVNTWETGILGYFNSVLSPEWHFESRSYNMQASYSEQAELTLLIVPSDGGKKSTPCRIPQPESFDRWHDMYSHPGFIDEVGFSGIGDISHNSTTCPTYLFVPPLCVQHTNGMYCLRFPLPDPLYYWTSDMEGEAVIQKTDYSRYGIPELKGTSTTNITSWMEYNMLETMDILGDPHDWRVEELLEETEQMRRFTISSTSTEDTPTVPRTSDTSAQPMAMNEEVLCSRPVTTSRKPAAPSV